MFRVKIEDTRTTSLFFAFPKNTSTVLLLLFYVFVGLIFFMVPFLTCFYLGVFIHRVSNIFEKWRAEGQEKIKFHRKIQPSTQEI